MMTLAYNADFACCINGWARQVGAALAPGRGMAIPREQEPRQWSRVVSAFSVFALCGRPSVAGPPAQALRLLDWDRSPWRRGKRNRREYGLPANRLELVERIGDRKTGVGSGHGDGAWCLATRPEGCAGFGSLRHRLELNLHGGRGSLKASVENEESRPG